MSRKELDEEEKKRSEEFLQKNISKIKKAWKKKDLGQISKLLYPEFDFEEPYGLLEPIEAPLHALFPFYKRIIFPINPLKREVFEKKYGITIGDLIKLCKEGCIFPMITDPFSWYPRDYDKLFELFEEFRIARWGRVTKSLDFIKKEETGISIKEETVREISNKFGMKPNFGELAIKHEEQGFSTEIGNDELLFRTFHSYLSGLRLLGCDEAYRNVMEIEKPNYAYELANSYYYVVDGSRIVTGLSGYANYDERFLLSLESKISKIPKRERTISLPNLLFYEFPKQLSSTYEHPENVKDPYEYFKKVEDIDETREAHRILLEVNKHFEGSEFWKARDNALEYRELMKQINEKVTNVERTHNFVKWALLPGFSVCTPTIVGVALQACNEGILSFLLLPEYLVGKKLGEIDNEKLSEALTELLSKVINRNSLPFLIWRFKKAR